MTNKKISYLIATLAIAAGIGLVTAAYAEDNTNGGSGNSNVNAPADNTNTPTDETVNVNANTNAPGRSRKVAPNVIGRFTGGLGINGGVRGTIATVSGNSVTITVDAGSVSSLTAGDAVTLIDTAKRTGIMPYDSNANMPAGEPGAQGNGQRFLSGKVTAVSGTMLTIQDGAGTAYTVDASQAKIHKIGNGNATVSDIPVGDRTIVRGTVNGTAVTASDVTDLPPVGQAVNQIKNQIKANGAESFFAKIGDFFNNLFHKKNQ